MTFSRQLIWTRQKSQAMRLFLKLFMMAQTAVKANATESLQLYNNQV